MEAASTSEMLISTYQTSGSYIPGNSHFYACKCIQITAIFMHASLSTFIILKGMKTDEQNIRTQDRFIIWKCRNYTTRHKKVCNLILFFYRGC
jgi:hypothetical protein